MIRKLCRECGLDSSGSRTDLLQRLSNEMQSREAYDKVFQKIWAASGKLYKHSTCQSFTVLVKISCNVIPYL